MRRLDTPQSPCVPDAHAWHAACNLDVWGKERPEGAKHEEEFHARVLESRPTAQLRTLPGVDRRALALFFHVASWSAGGDAEQKSDGFAGRAN